ncbi:hypothetical protein LCGC14_0351910 [marine sediment metagenome]|uniref:Uncharacterized protein n=1 Tax=marine sediment metagenome TaxID=412755 RepID=A0A0F9TTS1_9ZZZZ
MSKAIKCDRCGEFDTCDVYDLKFITADECRHNGYDADLCYNCATELQELLKKFFREVK